MEPLHKPFANLWFNNIGEVNVHLLPAELILILPEKKPRIEGTFFRLSGKKLKTTSCLENGGVFIRSGIERSRMPTVLSGALHSTARDRNKRQKTPGFSPGRGPVEITGNQLTRRKSY